MASPAPALTPSSPTMGSPPPGSPAGSNHLDVAAVAKPLLSPPPSPPPAPLSSAEPAGDPLQEKHYEAHRLLAEKKPEGARVLFLELIRDYQKNEETLLDLADYVIGLAYTYPAGDKERLDLAMKAKATLNTVYDKISSCGTINQQTFKYKQLRMMLEQFKFLIPDPSEPFKSDIASKIEECNHHIPILDDFHVKLAEGTQSYKAKDYDQASAFYTQALEMIKELSEPNYLLARALVTLYLAMDYLPKDDGSNRSALEAQVLTFETHERYEALFPNEKSKLIALNLFCQSFDRLSQTISGDGNIPTQIKEKLEECRRELDRLSPSPATGGSAGSKVSKDSVEPWKAARLFIAFSIAVAVIVGAAVLGRRFITRLN